VNNPDGLMREYIAGDEIRIIKLLKDTIGVDRKIAQLRWQFLDNVNGEGWITLAESNNEIIGQYCMMQIPLNFLGHKLLTGQSCDTMVRPDHQGRGWFVKLAKRNYEYAVRRGIEAVFGMPGRNSYPGFMRSLGWAKIVELKYFFYRLEFQKLKNLKRFALGQVLRWFFSIMNLLFLKIDNLRYGEHVDIMVSSVLPDNLSSMLLEINNYEVISFWKDLDYLKWRYERHPVFQYRFHILSVHGKPESLIVSKDCGESIAICELLSRVKNATQAVTLLHHVLAYYYRQSSASRVEFYGYDSGFFETVFRACCFKMQPRSDIVFGGRVFNDSRLSTMFYLPHNWNISYGDCDFI
jgi:hypothetical protein